MVIFSDNLTYNLYRQDYSGNLDYPPWLVRILAPYHSNDLAQNSKRSIGIKLRAMHDLIQKYDFTTFHNFLVSHGRFSNNQYRYTAAVWRQTSNV